MKKNIYCAILQLFAGSGLLLNSGLAFADVEFFPLAEVDDASMSFEELTFADVEFPSIEANDTIGEVELVEPSSIETHEIAPLGVMCDCDAIDTGGVLVTVNVLVIEENCDNVTDWIAQDADVSFTTLFCIATPMVPLIP